MMQTLVDSKSKTRLLEKLFERPDASFSVSGLGRLADLSKASVSNIVSEWEEAGLVLSTREGRNKMVYINTKFYLLPELKRIFKKTKDFQKPLLEELMKMPSLKNKEVKATVVFGSRTREDFTHYSDFDVLVVVDDKNSNVSEKIMEESVKASGKTGIRFSPVIMGKKDFKDRWKEKDKFLQNILAEGKTLKGGKWIEYAQASR
ncbi:MAG: winged helix-turn-helix transcriptional regulator [Candidatus Diapherotrites archaeon]|uniref:Winged helix-turn-helix transcriptional regulator n=1 Tax=Candidatus Iainarchaeum sp. TaxID=3101447 RepID=A0A8T3YMN5_9ARCH|nr:winged helix-turn-helix transcriptional regulator [Candidatus Diapherotrites archaeon]